MAVYINKIYIPNNIRKEIRTDCGSQEAARYLKAKYRWTQQILDDITKTDVLAEEDNHKICPQMASIGIKELWSEPWLSIL